MVLYFAMILCIFIGFSCKWNLIEFMLGLLLCIAYDIAQSCYKINHLNENKKGKQND